MAETSDGVSREERARMLQEVAERSSRILKEFGQKHFEQALSSAVKDELGVARAYMDLWSRTLMDPSALAAASINYWVDSMRLWHSTWMKMLGQQAQPVAEPAKGDARFKDADWTGNFVFDYLKQSYLIAARHIQHAVGGVEGLPEESQKKIAFFTRLFDGLNHLGAVHRLESCQFTLEHFRAARGDGNGHSSLTKKLSVLLKLSIRAKVTAGLNS